MIKLGIIGAMETEVRLLLEHLEGTQPRSKAGSLFYEGKLAGLPVVVVQCGVGKVNAAICTQILIDCFEVTHVLNTGIAGSLCAELDIGDFVVSQDAMYHDFNCTPFGYAPGQVPGMKQPTYAADDRLIAYAFSAAEAANPGHTRIGRVASGDQFVCQKEQKTRIIDMTGALCTEMEGAAIAHTAIRNGVPFVILRAISDKADDSAEMDYPTFEDIAAHRCARVAMAVAKRFAEE